MYRCLQDTHPGYRKGTMLTLVTIWGLPTPKEVNRLENSHPRLAYSVKEVSKLLGIGESTVWKLIRAGKLPTVKWELESTRIPAWAIEEIIGSPKDKGS
jgi:excisionase family DNA binding protein